MAKKDASTEVEVAEIVEENNGRGVTDVVAAIAGMNDSSAAFYSTLKGGDFASRKLIAAAQTKSTPIADALGKTINLVHFIIQAVQLEDSATGEIEDAPRVILIDEDNAAYHATSSGLLTALRNIIATLGEPETWPEALPIQVVEQRGRNGYRYMTIELV